VDFWRRVDVGRTEAGEWLPSFAISLTTAYRDKIGQTKPSTTPTCGDAIDEAQQHLFAVGLFPGPFLAR
jgi:hypothetical protein